jgi:hypothetical protein
LLFRSSHYKCSPMSLERITLALTEYYDAFLETMCYLFVDDMDEHFVTLEAAESAMFWLTAYEANARDLLTTQLLAEGATSDLLRITNQLYAQIDQVLFTLHSWIHTTPTTPRQFSSEVDNHILQPGWSSEMILPIIQDAFETISSLSVEHMDAASLM